MKVEIQQFKEYTIQCNFGVMVRLPKCMDMVTVVDHIHIKEIFICLWCGPWVKF
jgi:hypothetical protein